MSVPPSSMAPFKVGLKEIYLPKFSIALHRSPHLSPYHAQFSVPLWFSKLDLRDYLYHAYNVRVMSIRSYIKLQRITQGKNTSIRGEVNPRPMYKRWHRPRSLKRMTVELEQPFVWPEEATEEFMGDKFNKGQVEASRKEQKTQQERNSSLGDSMINEERREAMREQAKELLEGRAKWKPATGGAFGSFVSR